MNGVRIAIVAAVVLLWGVFVPVALAADHCAAMNGMCEGPCGASCAAAGPTVPAFTGLVSRAPSMPLPALPLPVPPTLELPPKSSALSA